MTATKDKETSGNGLKRNFALTVVVACFLFQLTALVPGDGMAQSKDSVQQDPPPNEEFLRESVRALLAPAFSDFPKDKSKLTFLKPEEDHPANWLLEDELISYLLASEYQVGLHSAEQSDNLPESRSLFYRIIQMSLEYPKIRRQGFLGKRLVTRKASLNLSFRLEDNATGKVLWTTRAKDEISDLIKRNKVKSLNNESYPFLSPSLPDDPQSRFIEPALVVAVVGGLIYLFFANR